MKNVKSTKAYLQQLHKKCSTHLDSFCNSLSPEDLHQLRVSIKKIKAVLLLLRYNNKDFTVKKHYRPLHTIFKHAGIIRDAQNNVTLMKQASEKSMAAQIKLLGATITVQSKLFAQQKANYLQLIKKSERKMHKHAAHLKHHDVQKALSKHLKELAALAGKLQSTKALHPFRAEVKTFIYNCSLLHKKELSQKEFQKILVLADKLQDIIGRWHDKETLLEITEPLNTQRHVAMKKKLLLEKENYIKQSYRLLKQLKPLLPLISF